MTLDEAIKEFTDWAKVYRDEMNYWLGQRNESDETSPLSYADCEGFARDKEESAERYEQLAEWLTELKEAKRLLKSAIDEWNLVCEWGNCGEYCGWYENGKCTQEWSCKAEALKLIGDESDGI